MDSARSGRGGHHPQRCGGPGWLGTATEGAEALGRGGEGLPRRQPPGGHARFLPRLVLPYVRHLKGEDDKPLPTSKPRKQYKMAKENRGDDGATERPKKAKEERRMDQVGLWLAGATLSPASCSPPTPQLPVATELSAQNTQNMHPGRDLQGSRFSTVRKFSTCASRLNSSLHPPPPGPVSRPEAVCSEDRASLENSAQRTARASGGPGQA